MHGCEQALHNFSSAVFTSTNVSFNEGNDPEKVEIIHAREATLMVVSIR